ncbi:MAG: Asp23/Gls24 family envelope stress response protein, partial [Anaerolineae bacterium]|nr:Asp23/Gls24 family envelope stress response protein [Thermoflexales bacterium]MDW8408551.1 Asp23/Gls24 family envelope stress response protein [Anaerolineae bacterium]
HQQEDGSRCVVVNINIIVEYGVRIQAVTGSLQQQVRYAIEKNTDYRVEAVNIHVTSLRVTHED